MFTASKYSQWFFVGDFLKFVEEKFRFYRKMAELDSREFWRSIMRNSDSEDDSVFEGFSMEDNRKDESDIDLDVLVDNDTLLDQMAPSDSVSEGQSTDTGDNDVILPPVAGPSSRKRRLLSKKKRNELTTRWSQTTSPVHPGTAFDVGTTPVGPRHDLPPEADEFSYFSLLLPEDFWGSLATQTNVYAQQRMAEKGADKNWVEATATEMKLFIFINFMFGIHRMPETSMYWSSDPLLRVPAIADVMSRNRFQKLSQYFHLSDNSKAVPKGQPGYDPLYKVRPLLDLVMENSHTHYNPGRDISIDEAMIKFNGRLSFKQYIKGEFSFHSQFQNTVLYSFERML